MFRIKDPVRSLAFYRDLLGMKLIAERHFSDFSLYFLQHNEASFDPTAEDGGYSAMKDFFQPVIELTHNHGTESDPEFKYHKCVLESVRTSHGA
jgi:lactoylglutathione lyase